MMYNSGCMVTYHPMIRDSVSTRPGNNEWSCFQQGMILPHNSRGLHCDCLIKFSWDSKKHSYLAQTFHRIWFYKTQVTEHLNTIACMSMLHSLLLLGSTQNWQSYGLFGKWVEAPHWNVVFREVSYYCISLVVSMDLKCSHFSNTI